MRKLIAVILVGVGVVLLFLGFGASQSLVSEVSEFFTGSPSDKSLYLFGSSLVCLLVGGVLLTGPSKGKV